MALLPPSPASLPDDAVESRAHQDFRDATGTYTYDDDGFRAGSGLPYERSILFIGDSFTEGRGVSDDQTFARAAERALRRDGVMARSLNAGHRDFGPAQELKGRRSARCPRAGKRSSHGDRRDGSRPPDSHRAAIDPHSARSERPSGRRGSRISSATR